jgi:hypothetical protein
VPSVALGDFKEAAPYLPDPDGRWPTNAILSHAEECGPTSATPCVPGCPVLELGYDARFYPAFRFEPKAPTKERPNIDGLQHATVKPLALMAWLLDLVVCRGNRVGEPFAGSGTTVEAAVMRGEHRLDRRPEVAATELAERLDTGAERPEGLDKKGLLW